MVRSPTVARRANVIVSAYATTPFMSGPGLSMFDEETVLVEVPFDQGGEALADKAFRRTISKLKDWKDGSVLRSLLRQSLPDGVTPKSIALITFSAGTVFAKAVLEGADADCLDSLIVLDGLHFARNWQGVPYPVKFNPWVKFGERAAFDERLMVLAETDIVPYNVKDITSTSESTQLVMDAVSGRIGPSAPIKPPSYMRFGDAAASGALEWESIGNLWYLEYGGTQGSDHIRVSRSASEAIWRTFLVPRWNAGITCRAPDLAVSGLGQTCEPNRVEVPEGMYEPNVLRDYVLPGAVVAGILGGTYLVGTRLARYL